MSAGDLIHTVLSPTFSKLACSAWGNNGSWCQRTFIVSINAPQIPADWRREACGAAHGSWRAGLGCWRHA